VKRPRQRRQFEVERLKNWKLLQAFQRRVLPLLERQPISATEEDPRRTLQALDYTSAFLFAMLNPALTSLNLVAEASRCEKMRQVTAAPFSAASFSEAQHWFNPAVLEKLARELAREVQALGLAAANGDPRLRRLLKSLTAVDGTIFRAVERMHWAPAAGYGKAVRLHLHFRVLEDVPEDWTITPGTTPETDIFESKAQAGAFYVADRLYATRHAVLEELRQKGVDFVFRLGNHVIMEPVEEPRALSTEDAAAGVAWDCRVRLGVHGTGPTVRVVRVLAGEKIFHLVTSREDLPAEIIGHIYRQRWEIEVFFKWIKTIFNCRHWLAESPQGAAIQLYTVLVAGLLLMLWTGQRPNRRMIEVLRLYLIGWATEEELLHLLERAAGRKKK
jgi:hypothetical protein